MGPLSALPLVKIPFKILAYARGATYRSETELTNEVATRLPKAGELRTIEDVDVQVRSKASPPWLSEFYSRQVLASVHVELVDEAPPYDVFTLQRRLRNSGIPDVQVFSKKIVENGDLGMNEHLLYSRCDDSAFEVLVELGSNVGKIEQWIRDLDVELLAHLREMDDELRERFDPNQYEHGDRMGTNITAHLNRSSRKGTLDRLLTRAEEEAEDVTVFRRWEPDWYLERVGGSDRTNDTIIAVSHRVRVDDWRDGVSTEKQEFQDSVTALEWLYAFIQDPPETLEPRDFPS